MKKITLILAFVLVCFATKAQSYVTIPDSNFVSWLNVNIPSAMVGNQMDILDINVTSLTAMNVSYDTIYDLTGIQYFTSLQNLDCSFNRLDTLQYLPATLQSLTCNVNYLVWIDSFPASLTNINCNQNSLDSIPVMPSSLTLLHCENNQLVSLPTIPNTLVELHCSGNLIAVLPLLPASLTIIMCGQNELDSLPVLPVNLTTLNCMLNNLDSLPTLPTTLIDLTCNNNNIAALPSLPLGLQSLICDFNVLTTLPTLPSSLTNLVCSNNLIPVLPTLPGLLSILKCYYNLLPVLPTLPSSLTYLDCSNNVLPNLPTLPGALSYLDCSFNPLPSLPTLPSSLNQLRCTNNTSPALPTLPSALTYLDCSSNLMPTLPTLPASLSVLYCNANPLDSIPTLPSSLIDLRCTNSTLDSLPALPISLTVLKCTSNFLIQLPALPNALQELWCEYNQLTSLPTLPAGLVHLQSHTNMINCFPIFPSSILYLNIFSNPFTCLPNYIPAMDSLMLEMYLCVAGDFVHNPHNCAGSVGVVGFTYIDNNSDCLKDSLDFRLKNIPIKLYDSLGTLLSQTYTAINGVYNFPKSAGTYGVVDDTAGFPYTPQCINPGVDSTVSTYATPLTTDVNFNFNCKPGFDLGVQSVTRCGWPFPGEQHKLTIKAGDLSQIYNLNCAAGISGLVNIEVTGPVTFDGPIAGALTPTITGTMYSYSISDFAAINYNSAFGMLFTTDTNAAAGAIICVYIDVTPIGGDNYPTNNSFDFCYEVVNSHDPNIKETYPELVPLDYDDYFTYTVHFQNTGTAPAFNIHIEDTLDSNLDLTTFQFMDASHDDRMVTLNGNSLSVLFPNIMLVDSTVSADSSKGYIQYRIKPKTGLNVFTQIYNTAHIYFDYNEAIVTNTTINAFRPYTTGIDDAATAEGVTIYPNPASEFVNIKFNSTSKNNSIKIFDATGRLVKNMENVKSGENTINVSELENGLYLINVNDGRSSVTKRIVKQ